jgi:L-lactate dehydrogenase complex protein LldF
MGEWPLRERSLRERTAVAVADPVLRGNVAGAVDRFTGHKAAAFADVHDPDGLRTAARGLRSDVLARWSDVLGGLADNVLANGGHVHWARTAEEANEHIAAIATQAGARTAVKSKSMVTEETGLNDALAAVGCEVTETDLGEWIIQLAGEHPSHIIIPAVHRNRHQIAETFRREAGLDEPTTDPEALVAFARAELRRRFLDADLGITGVNLAVAESGSVVLVTNEGNARLVTALPRVHVAVMGAERVVETWDQADLLLGLLARSATGQSLSTYTQIISGPAPDQEVAGPDEFHLVILDNGRSDLAGTEFAEMLNCIRCGACLNVCPVYRQTGGHAYGWVYSGPMGAVLTPLLGAEGETDKASAAVADASTLCGACMDACPVQIPLQDLLLSLRRRNATTTASPAERAVWAAWSAAWSRPWAYRVSLRVGRLIGRIGPVSRRLPGVRRWATGRDVPTLPRRTFTERWGTDEI